MNPNLARPALSTLLTLIIVMITPQFLRAAQSPALIIAVKNGDHEKFNELLPAPGQASVRDAHGNTALHWAALASSELFVARLLAAGFDSNAINDAGATPLHYGVGSEQVVVLLLK